MFKQALCDKCTMLWGGLKRRVVVLNFLTLNYVSNATVRNTLG
ncbi:hypothetical protein PSPO_b0149 [Pseudoalteromonas spongiae UST010723-006]|nr:hypothetical protein PSPO_b0149 [Pseudoalteromonas spongiae UST010723-006]